MATPKINLKEAKAKHGQPVLDRPPTPSRPWWRRFWLSGPLLFVSVGIFAYSITAQLGQINQSATGTSFFVQLGHLLTTPDRAIAGEADDRINVLLLGIGGEGHQGALLTDTIIVASVKPSTGQVAMLSIPRDLVVTFPNQTYRKINNAVYLGDILNYPGGGEQLSADIVTDVTGLDIHYYGQIDFNGFKQVIDLVGGVTVVIERSFTDYQYPTLNFGYQTVSFAAGRQTLTGDQALKFVRSRHGNNGEGSDFARSARQQKVLSAIKDKALSVGTLTNPVKLQKVVATLSAHVKTNAELWELARLSNIVKEANTSNIRTVVLDNSPEGLLITTTGQDGAYLLEPRSGDYREIRQLARGIFDQPTDQAETATVAIHNGTSIGGLARQAAQRLQTASLLIVEIGNAFSRDADQTVIYDLTGGQKPVTLAYLKQKLGANRVASNLPFFLDNYYDLTYETISRAESPVLGLTTAEPVDFLIVIGRDAIVSSSAARRKPTA